VAGDTGFEAAGDLPYAGVVVFVGTALEAIEKASGFGRIWYRRVGRAIKLAKGESGGSIR
jgi:hypothetical protein